MITSYLGAICKRTCLITLPSMLVVHQRNIGSILQMHRLGLKDQLYSCGGNAGIAHDSGSPVAAVILAKPQETARNSKHT